MGKEKNGGEVIINGAREQGIYLICHVPVPPLPPPISRLNITEKLYTYIPRNLPVPVI